MTKNDAHDVAIRLGAEDDIAPFLECLEEAASWLWRREIRQWEPGTQRDLEPFFRHLISDGVLVVAEENGVLVGGCVLTRREQDCWEGRAGDAIYLYKLVTARSAAGRGLGRRLLGFAAKWARDAGASFLRLDCWEGNVTLRAYYREEMTELSAALEHGYEVRLFEKVLAGSAA